METEKNSLTVPAAIVVAGVLVAGAIYLSGRGNDIKPAARLPAENEERVVLEPITAGDHILGNPAAPIKIVEFSDLECPFCKMFHTTLHRIIDDFGKDGQVAWVYRHFPIDSLHTKARTEAYASECAGELGGNAAFWKYADRLFSITPSNDGLDLAKLPQIAADIGLPVEKFNQCLSSGKYADKVEKQYQDGVGAGGRGTPYSVIVTKDEKIPIPEGAVPYETLKAIIEELVKK